MPDHLKNQLKDIWNYLKVQRPVRLASLGLMGAILFTCMRGTPTLPPPQHLATPSSSPFENSISGNGFVEANTQNIQVGSFSSGIVSQVFVKPGDHVQTKQPLFELDKRSAEAQVALDTVAVETARHAVDVAEAKRLEANDQYQRAQKVKDGYLSAEETKKREYAVRQLDASLLGAKTQLKEAESKLQLSQIALDKLTVLAPVDGLICKVNVRVGEYVSEAIQSQAFVVMGNDQPLHVRVQLDEHDAWRMSKDAKAVAFLPGCDNASIPLIFVRLEPYAGPKQQLSGDSRDIVDTRVVEIIYATQPPLKYPLYVGQQVDVFVEDKTVEIENKK